MLHWTAGPGDALSLQRYLGSTKDQSSYQYGVDDVGRVLEYVDPDNVAWHAGDGNHGWDPQTLYVSGDTDLCDHRWDFSTLAAKPLGEGPGLAMAHNKDGTYRVNHASIGIGLCNRGPLGAAKGGLPGVYDRPGFKWTHFEPYATAQIEALNLLVEYLADRYPSLRFVCGHEDFTKQKGDPGPLLYDWLPPASTGLGRLRYDWRRRTFHLSTAEQDRVTAMYARRAAWDRMGLNVPPQDDPADYVESALREYDGPTGTGVQQGMDAQMDTIVADNIVVPWEGGGTEHDPDDHGGTPHDDDAPFMTDDTTTVTSTPNAGDE